VLFSAFTIHTVKLQLTVFLKNELRITKNLMSASLHSNTSTKSTFLGFLSLTLCSVYLFSCTSIRKEAVRSALERGDFNRAVSYMQGLSLAERKSTVSTWCQDNEKTAQLGKDTKTMVNAGYCYENGLAGSISRKLAAKWYRKAAKGGDIEGNQGLLRLGCNRDETCQ
jgi:hypothetical protein